MKDPADLTPREIVAELDRYIIGQDKAKRAVAIAVRNRWRRQQLPEGLREDVGPKNIIMMGPTGVGKTEIARRLAAIGSGGGFALAAARALVRRTDLSAAEIVRDSLEIAADLCIYTNRTIEVEEL